MATQARTERWGEVAGRIDGRHGAERLARGLGWLGIGLSVAEIVAPQALARVIGIDGASRLAGRLPAALDERRSHWVARGPAGVRLEWDAEITEDSEPHLIAFVITHRLALEDAPHGYDMFLSKQDECIKVVLRP
jgi:hypothetical protein